MKKSLVVLFAVLATMMVKAEGYYVVGLDGNWTTPTPQAKYKMSVNPDNSNEQMITLDIAAESKLKVAYSPDDANFTAEAKDWFPDGYSNELTVHDAGNYTIYCRTTKDADDSWYEHCLKLKKNAGSSIDAVIGAGTQSKKVMLNGTMYILRNGVYYNTNGTEVK